MTEPFDVCGPLPEGTVVLEASAGTGKTFTIAALAARYVAAGVPLERVLLVTFTRMATGELRERVRDRLVSAERGLARVMAGGRVPGDDEVLALLASGPAGEVAARRARLAAALSDFDAATIATTHGFCQHMLASLGVAGDVEEGTTFVDDATDLVDEVVDDLYVRRFAPGRDEPPFGREDARRIGRLAVSHPGAPIEPTGAPEASERAMRARLARAVRDEVEARKRRRGIVTYDDLLTRLAAALSDPLRGPAACARLRERYRVALVDEFQDTDPIQWDILRRAFAEAGPDAERSTLVLIGDPKQAIYAFRGADVHAYLDAAAHAGTRATLGVNWRSDQTLLDAYDALWRGTRLGHDDIRYRVVRSAPAHRDARLVGAPDNAPLRVRIARRDAGQLVRTPKGHAAQEPARAHVAADVAADIVDLLNGKTELVERDADGTETGRQPLRPGHVAVLVRTYLQGAAVRDALAALGVPAVLNGAGSVFATPVARDWLVLLEALERPSAPVRAHTVALSPFIGWDGEQVATAAEERWEDVYARLHRWAGVLRRRGVAALVDAVTLAGLPARVLARPDGERVLTDLRHIGELLHAEAVAASLGATALAGWLRRRIAEAGEDGHDEDRARRLESDAEAVQVLTIHRSKGLEFPVVHLPFLWDFPRIRDDDHPVYHDPANGGRLTIDVGRGGRDLVEHHQLYVEEQRGEDLRLAYVALTRARHQAVVWWASSWESRNSPLGRLVACRDDDGRVAAEGSAVPAEDEVEAWFGRVVEEAGLAPGTISVTTTSGATGRRWVDATAPAGTLTVNRFTRRLDTDWRRTSYTALTATIHNGVVAEGEPHDPEPGDGTVADEAMGEIDGTTEAPAPAVITGDAAGLDAVVPLSDVPGGAAVGSLLHAVLEEADFAAADLDAELDRHLAAAQARGRVEIGDPAVALAGVRAAIETPLGPLAGGLALREVTRADRLDELAFELPLGGGDHATGRAPTVAAVAGLLRSRIDPRDPLAGYADRLTVPELQHDLRGFLTGAIDVVLRVRPDGGGDRYVVVDHKTNWLGEPGEPLTVGHYRPAALADAMQRAHYPLQALLYSVALHRYLRWRLADYDPDRHLGGVLYLFLRGMTGRSVPHVDGHPCGVFSWAAPPGLVPALSDLLDEGAA